MSMTPEDLQALSEARGRPRDYAADVAAAYASKTAAYGTGGTTVTPVTTTDGRGQFTAEQAAAIDAAAYQAAGFSGDAATADYIRQLQSGALGGGADTQAALERLIAEGKARNVATFGVETGDDGLGGGGGPMGHNNNLPLLILFLVVHAQMRRTPFEQYWQPTGWVNYPTICTVFMLAAKSTSTTLTQLFFLSANKTHTRKRFAANAARAKKGLAELDPASYLQLENQYRQLLQSNGLPSGFYDQHRRFYCAT
jgi:hypothetical protein